MNYAFDVDETYCPIINEKVDYYDDCRYCKHNENYGTVFESIECELKEENNE